MNIFRRIFGLSDDDMRPQPLRLLQLHEYLPIVGSGVKGYEPDNATRDACLNAATATWRFAGLSKSGARHRAIQHCYKCGDRVHGIAHINSDDDDCFLIIVFNQSTATPVGYLVLDIKADYRKPVYECPLIRFKGEPTASLIETTIPNLTTKKNSYAILDFENGTYMQTCRRSANSFILEHQLANIDNHYEAVGDMTAQQVIAAFKSYAFGKKEWAKDIQWKKMEL